MFCLTWTTQINMCRVHGWEYSYCIVTMSLIRFVYLVHGIMFTERIYILNKENSLIFMCSMKWKLEPRQSFRSKWEYQTEKGTWKNYSVIGTEWGQPFVLGYRTIGPNLCPNLYIHNDNWMKPVVISLSGQVRALSEIWYQLHWQVSLVWTIYRYVGLIWQIAFLGW